MKRKIKLAVMSSLIAVSSLSASWNIGGVVFAEKPVQDKYLSVSNGGEIPDDQVLKDGVGVKVVAFEEELTPNVKDMNEALSSLSEGETLAEIDPDLTIKTDSLPEPEITSMKDFFDGGKFYGDPSLTYQGNLYKPELNAMYAYRTTTFARYGYYSKPLASIGYTDNSNIYFEYQSGYKGFLYIGDDRYISDIKLENGFLIPTGMIIYGNMPRVGINIDLKNKIVTYSGSGVDSRSTPSGYDISQIPLDHLVVGQFTLLSLSGYSYFYFDPETWTLK